VSSGEIKSWGEVVMIAGGDSAWNEDVGLKANVVCWVIYGINGLKSRDRCVPSLDCTCGCDRRWVLRLVYNGGLEIDFGLVEERGKIDCCR
jgi:hypothetical protein